MLVSELIDAGVEIQSEYRYCYYDYNSDRRVEISQHDAYDLTIRYMYVDNGMLYIEVEKEEE